MYVTLIDFGFWKRYLCVLCGFPGNFGTVSSHTAAEFRLQFWIVHSLRYIFGLCVSFIGWYILRFEQNKGKNCESPSLGLSLSPITWYFSYMYTIMYNYYFWLVIYKLYVKIQYNIYSYTVYMDPILNRDNLLAILCVDSSIYWLTDWLIVLVLVR